MCVCVCVCVCMCVCVCVCDPHNSILVLNSSPIAHHAFTMHTQALFLTICCMREIQRGNDIYESQHDMIPRLPYRKVEKVVEVVQGTEFANSHLLYFIQNSNINIQHIAGGVVPQSLLLDILSKQLTDPGGGGGGGGGDGGGGGGGGGVGGRNAPISPPHGGAGRGAAGPLPAFAAPPPAARLAFAL